MDILRTSFALQVLFVMLESLPWPFCCSWNFEATIKKSNFWFLLVSGCARALV